MDYQGNVTLHPTVTTVTTEADKPLPVAPRVDKQTDFERLLSKPVVPVGSDTRHADKPSPPTATLTHQERFQMWRDRCAYWLREKHGRNSLMARHLGVSRQTVWRWFFCNWSTFPGWAAVASNIFYSQNVAPDLDKRLRREQLSGTFQLPVSRSRRTKFVAGSADKPRSVVITEADEWEET